MAKNVVVDGQPVAKPVQVSVKMTPQTVTVVLPRTVTKAAGTPVTKQTKSGPQTTARAYTLLGNTGGWIRLGETNLWLNAMLQDRSQADGVEVTIG